MAVDEAALDAFLASDGEVAAPAETAPETAAPVSAPVAEAEVPEPPANQDTFDRAYVEKLRKESANYRERAKRYQEAFDGYEPEAVDEFLGLAQSLRADPLNTAERFQELADAIRSQYGNAAGDEAEAALGIADNDPDLSDNKPLTQADFDRMWNEKQREIDLQNRVAKIESDATALGYEKGTRQYDRLLWEATRLPSGSIHEAHEHLQRERQAVIDAYVAEMGGQPAPTVPTGGVPASGEKKLTSFAEANEALDAWLQQQF